jgi:hypothetical protein
MDKLQKELNEAIGVLRATKEYLGEEKKVLVDISIPAWPHIMESSKALIIANLTRVEMAMLQCVDKLQK